MTYQTIISTEELAKHTGDPSWLIFDCRFDLARPVWGFMDYQLAHLPGAIYADLNRDLSGQVTPETGRHPLPDPVLFSKKCAQWGIDPGKQVIVYDISGGGYASRLWWMLRALGHPAVALLDGGFPQWLIEGRPVETGIIQPQSSQFLYPADFSKQGWVNTKEVTSLISDPHIVLVDARAPERFRGEIEPIDPAAGHIPGAVNRFHGLNLAADGRMKSKQELETEFGALFMGKNPHNVIVYCGSGVTSCHHLLALEFIGISGVKLYPGSWSEWIRNVDHPQARGA